MNASEIRNLLDVLTVQSQYLEDRYIESGGEITEDTEAMEDQIAAIKELLTGEGVDSLGRWLKNVEDQAAAMKAEKAAIDGQIKSKSNTVNYIKYLVNRVMVETGMEKAKGLAYSFTKSQSVTTETDKELLRELYQDKAERALREAGIPDWVGITLTASVKAVPEGEALPEVFNQVTKDTVTFRKPRKAEE